MIGIVFATRREAKPFLGMVAAVPIDDKVLPLFRLPTASHPGCLVAVSGMGKVAATLAAVHLVVAYGVEMLVNAGLCGRLTAEKPWGVGDLLRIDRSVEGDCDRFGLPEPSHGCDAGWFADLDAARLVTCDRPVFEATRRRELVAVADLADMEGAAVARGAHRYGIACAMLKGISDCADGTGRQDIARHLPSVSQKIARRLVGALTLHVTEESA
jgi:adenosylhomocysteine nucleosidase